MTQLSSCANSASPPRPGWLAGAFSLDTRSLAAMRIGLGLVLLLNVCDLAWEIPAFYTDAGLMPREARMQLNSQEQFTAPPYWCSLHMLSGQAWFQGLLFAASGVLAILVIAGYRTTWALFGSWLLLVGMQGRNPIILQGGDDILRCLLFWSLFSPLGARWSIDSRRAGRSVPQQVCSFASAALLIQLVCIYLFTALLKYHPQWRGEFTAIYYALHCDHFTSRLGTEMLRFPLLLQGLTLGTVVLELAGPWLLFCPWRNPQVRMLVVTSFFLLHLGIAATMDLGLFPATCLVYWLAILPGKFWELSVWRRFVPTRASSPAPACLVAPAPPSIAQNVLIVVLLCYVIMLNTARLLPSIDVHLKPSPLRTLGDAAQLDQFWCMFAPRPHDFGGWFNARGTLADGTRVNLLHPELPPQEARPPHVSGTYPSLRWRKLLVNLYERDCPTFRRGVGDYLRRRWNETHGPNEQLVAVELIVVKQWTVPPGEQWPPKPAESLLLWHWAAAGMVTR